MKNRPVVTRSRESESGSIVIIAALSLVAILGVAALALDASYMYDVRDRMGAAADAAAKAAAVELSRTGDSAALTKFGQDAAERVGFSDGVNGISVTISHPPTEGLFVGDTRFIEAVVSQDVPTFLLHALGRPTMTVVNRATAGGNVTPPCVIALNGGNVNAALSISASVLDLVGCTVDVNSTSTTSANCSGATNISGAIINLVGDSSNCSTHIGGPPSSTLHTGQMAATDPFGSVPEPYDNVTNPNPCMSLGATVQGLVVRSVSLLTNPVSLQPGIYCGGVKWTGSNPGTLAAGTYVMFGGGFVDQSSGLITGTGVTIFNSGSASFSPGQILISGGNAKVTFAAPTSGALAGILFFQDRVLPSQPTLTVQGGSPDVNLTGSLYLHSGPISYTGGSAGTAPYTFLVADTISFTGGSRLRNNISGISGGAFQDARIAQ